MLGPCKYELGQCGAGLAWFHCRVAVPVGLEWFTRRLSYELREWLLTGAGAGAQAVPEDADGGGGIHICLEGMMKMFLLFAWGLEGKNNGESNWG
jgi:hypothetical protein